MKNGFISFVLSLIAAVAVVCICAGVLWLAVMAFEFIVECFGTLTAMFLLGATPFVIVLCLIFYFRIKNSCSNCGYCMISKDYYGNTYYYCSKILDDDDEKCATDYCDDYVRRKNWQ